MRACAAHHVCWLTNSTDQGINSLSYSCDLYKCVTASTNTVLRQSDFQENNVV